MENQFQENSKNSKSKLGDPILLKTKFVKKSQGYENFSDI